MIPLELQLRGELAPLFVELFPVFKSVLPGKTSCLSRLLSGLLCRFDLLLQHLLLQSQRSFLLLKISFVDFFLPFPIGFAWASPASPAKLLLLSIELPNGGMILFLSVHFLRA